MFGLPDVFADGQYVIASRYPLRACALRRAGPAAQSLGYVRCIVDVRGVAVSLVAVHFESPRSGLNAARHDGLEGTPQWRRTMKIGLRRRWRWPAISRTVRGRSSSPATSTRRCHRP